ncbi:MAG: hypothetical protein RLZZ611_1658 [Cyanobacteriota bacterium]
MPRRIPPQKPVLRWQNSRTWARLIREAEALWHVDVRDLRRLGALELGQLLVEVPPSLRSRVNRWLASYHVATRLELDEAGGREPPASARVAAQPVMQRDWIRSGRSDPADAALPPAPAGADPRSELPLPAARADRVATPGSARCSPQDPGAEPEAFPGSPG